MIGVTEKSAGGIISSNVTYTYDALNRRIAVTTDADGAGPEGSVRLNLLLDRGRSWADADSAGVIVNRYLFGARIDQILASQNPSTGIAWYLNDHIGSVRDIVDSAGISLNHYEYTAFGVPLVASYETGAQRYMFAGREYDSVTSVYYNRARSFDPRAGRFMSEDPIGFRGHDYMLYRYAYNNPILLTDPTGLSSLDGYTLTQKGALVLAINVSCFANSLQAMLRSNRGVGMAVGGGLYFAICQGIWYVNLPAGIALSMFSPLASEMMAW